MKHIFTALFLVPLSLSAQDFNMNKIAGEYIQDGIKLYGCPNRNAACEWYITRQDLPGKDSDGNPIVSFSLTEKQNALNKEAPDTVLFLPDSPIYSVQMQLFYHKHFVNAYRPSFDDNGNRRGSIYTGGNTVYITPSKNPMIINDFSGMTYKHLTWESRISRDTKDGLKAAYRGDAKRATKEVYHYMDAIDAYLKKKLEDAANMDYDQEVQKYLSSGDVYYMVSPPGHGYGEGRMDAFKVIWPSSGDKSSFQMNFPFTDGKYYDKEQFLFTVKKNPSYSGMYEYNSDKLVVGSGLLVPFEDLLIVVTKCGNSTANQPDGKNYCVVGIITKNLTSPWILSIRSGNFVNEEWVSSVASSAHYEQWQMNQELTTSYDYHKDYFRVANYMMKYIPALIKK